jgi:hypothetical protein
MPLRDADEVGLRDVRRFKDLQVTSSEAAEPSQARPGADRHPEAAPLAAVARACRGLGDERLAYLQADVPEEALKRLKKVSFELAGQQPQEPQLAHHQTILGALIDAHVDHTDERRLTDLARLLDAYRDSPWRALATPRRLSARVPASLKRRTDGCVLALSLTGREVSVKLLVAALVWHHVRSKRDDPELFAALVGTTAAYHEQMSQRSVGEPEARLVA